MNTRDVVRLQNSFTKTRTARSFSNKMTCWFFAVTLTYSKLVSSSVISSNYLSCLLFPFPPICLGFVYCLRFIKGSLKSFAARSNFNLSRV